MAHSTEADRRPRDRRLDWAAEIVFYAVSLGFSAYLFRYYMTGLGGPTLLAVSAVPLAFAVVILNDLRKGALYPALGRVGAWALALVQVGFAFYAMYYLVREFDAIRMTRLGIWNAHDLAVGGIMAALILEYTRRHYFVLFVINVVLILYTVYGDHVPGLFNHSGMPWKRVLSSVSVEMSTGIFERLPQLGLTLIGSFILVLAALRAFGCIDSILLAASRLAARSPALLPQAAVIGSFGVAAVSGSGAANAATTGSATIPALIRAGFPRVTAAAVETAASLGGQLMPPLMGIAAFLMAEYLQVSYFEVVARGFAPAIVYFIGVAFAVYLLALRYRRHAAAPEVPPLTLIDKGNLAAYLLSVAGLVYLMGVAFRPAMTSAQTVFLILVAALTAMFLLQCWQTRSYGARRLARPFVRMIESFASITGELTILLATLGVLTASFTITGVPTKVGAVLMEGASINMVVMALVAFGFGYLVGMGLPPAPTYIVTAVVIAPFMVRAGLDPWVVHFFAFFVAVFGELSPPTSVVAAVTSRIAEASFMRTMLAALMICMPLMVMMAAVFTRSGLVLEPGLPQIPDFLILIAATLTLSFAFQGRLAAARLADLALRALLALLALVAILHPAEAVAAGAAVVGLVGAAAGFFGMLRARAPESAGPGRAAAE